MTDGVREGKMMIIAGQPGSGKTSLGLQIARNIADDPEKHVLFISLEMTGEELACRMFCEMNELNYTNVRKGVEIDGWGSLDDGYEDYLQHIHLDVVDNKGYTFKEVNEIINDRYGTEHQPDIIFIDYLGCISTVGYRDDKAALEEFLRNMVEKCKKNNIALVMLSQLRRQPPGANLNKAPQLSDLRGSGTIEQQAFTVLFTYRKSGMVNGVFTNGVFINIAKNKDGMTGEKEYEFKGESFKFKEKTRWVGRDDV